MFWKLAVFFPANCGYPHQELHNFAFLLQCQVSEMNFTFLFQSFHQKALLDPPQEEGVFEVSLINSKFHLDGILLRHYLLHTQNLVHLVSLPS